MWRNRNPEVVNVHTGASVSTTEAEISYRSVLEQISILLKRLPGKKQNFFYLRRFEGKSAKEIAALGGVRPKTVDNQIIFCSG
jgi:DNA-directed RNA polymerase specialized sigma24 family protein